MLATTAHVAFKACDAAAVLNATCAARAAAGRGPAAECASKDHLAHAISERLDARKAAAKAAAKAAGPPRRSRLDLWKDVMLGPAGGFDDADLDRVGIRAEFTF